MNKTQEVQELKEVLNLKIKFSFKKVMSTITLSLYSLIFPCMIILCFGVLLVLSVIRRYYTHLFVYRDNAGFNTPIHDTSLPY